MKSRVGKVTIVQFAVLVVMAGFVATGSDASVTHEARFADRTVSGLAIVPASGVSETSYTGAYTGAYTASYSGSCPYPIETGWDAYGRILYANYTQRNLNANGYNKCLNNNSANTFFVPVGSAAETAAFLNAAPGLNIGVTDNIGR